MAIPAFVTASAWINAASAASAAPVLPTSRVNNNVLITYCFVMATGKTLSVSAGWTIADSINTGNMSGAWAWRLVTGSETAPTWSWTGNAANVAQVLQFSGNATPTAVGAKNKPQANSTTSLAVTGLTTTAQNSLIHVIATVSNNQTIPAVDSALKGFTNLGTAASANGSSINITGPKNATGAAPGFTETITTANFTAFSIEILGSGSGTSNVRSSQVIQQTLDKYSNTTNVLATQVIQQTLDIYNNTTNLIATQVIQQTLRSVSDFIPVGPGGRDNGNKGNKGQPPGKVAKQAWIEARDIERNADRLDRAARFWPHYPTWTDQVPPPWTPPRKEQKIWKNVPKQTKHN